ncbi:MAG: hypothetical protein ACFCD0_12930 [Gemmataceae bacterium]
MFSWLKQLFAKPNYDLYAGCPFERRLLNWLQNTVGVRPYPDSGMNTNFWKFRFQGNKVELAVIRNKQNTALELSPDVEWLIRVEEPEPLKFIHVLEKRFVPKTRVQKNVHYNGTIRMQFKSTELLLDSDLSDEGTADAPKDEGDSTE